MSDRLYSNHRASHRGKIRHRWLIGAWWHLVRLRWRYGYDGQPMDAYPCHWPDDFHLSRWGWSDRRHWHIGRRNKWRSYQERGKVAP